jgi:hypothetical protein
MTVQLIRVTAKELAGVFYEQAQRSEAFRRAFPNVREYLRGRAHRRDGTTVQEDPNWWRFVDLAKRTMTAQLRDPNISPIVKEAIAEALIEEAHRGSKAKARQVMQSNLDKREDQKLAYTHPGIIG